MSQHDYDITTADANTGSTMRAAINAAFQALAGNNSGATEPAAKYPYMWWADTTSGYLKQRNAANTAWITVMLLATALMSDSDKCDGFHASQTPGANQIPVLNSSGRLVLDGTDDGSSKIQTGGNIKAGNNLLMGGELIGPSSLKIHPNTSDGADSGVSTVCGGGWPQPYRGGFLEVRGNESAPYPGDVRIISGGDSTFGNIYLLTGGGYERFRITPSGRILAGPTLPTDNGVDAFQLNGMIASKGIKLDGTASANVNTLDYYKEGTFIPVAIGSTTAGTGTYSAQIGHYTRVGNRVDYYIWIAWSEHTGAGDMIINGLPFASKSNCYMPGSIFSNAILGDSVTLVPRIPGASTQIDMLTSNSITGATINFTLPSSKTIAHIQGTYFV